MSNKLLNLEACAVAASLQIPSMLRGHSGQFGPIMGISGMQSGPFWHLPNNRSFEGHTIVLLPANLRIFHPSTTIHPSEEPRLAHEVWSCSKTNRGPKSRDPLSTLSSTVPSQLGLARCTSPVRLPAEAIEWMGPDLDSQHGWL